MKTFVIIYFAITMTGLSQTNLQFVTEKASTNFEMFTVVTNPTPLADAQPAKDDSVNNWGEVRDGAQISIRLSKTSYMIDEPINATILLRNVSDKQVKFLFFEPKDAILKLILTKESQADTNGIQMTATNLVIPEISSRGASGKVWRPIIQAGKQYAFNIGLTNFYSLSAGKYKIQAKQPVLNQAHNGTTNLSSGYASFEVVAK
jgi:uncharacterized protein (DUF2147 family)